MTQTQYKIGMVGLGRMGANMSLRLLRAGHVCVVYNRSPQPVIEMEKQGATGAALSGFQHSDIRLVQARQTTMNTSCNEHILAASPCWRMLPSPSWGIGKNQATGRMPASISQLILTIVSTLPDDVARQKYSLLSPAFFD
jgi:hypothetical protein